MAENISQNPDILNINLKKGDSLSLVMDFETNLSGYTFESGLILSDSKSILYMLIEEVDLTLGRINVLLSNKHSMKLENTYYSWFLKWIKGSETRTLITGEIYIYE